MSASQSKIVVIVAVARNGVIGRDNQLIWRLRSDLRRFKSLTMGKPLLMGRKTYESLGRPLPGRRTLVLTRDSSFTADGVAVVHDWDEAIAAAGDDDLMVAGGAQIYALALPHADAIHLTEVDASPEGDTVFPPFDRATFRETMRERHPAAEHDDHPFDFVDLIRLT